MTRRGQVTTNYLNALQEALEVGAAEEWRGDVVSTYLAASHALLRNDLLAERLVEGYRLGESPRPDTDFDTALGRDALYVYVLARHFPERMARLDGEALRRLVQPVFEDRFNTLSAAYTILALGAIHQNLEARGELSPPAIAAQTADGPVEVDVAPGVFARASLPVTVERLDISGAAPGGVYYTASESGFDVDDAHGARRRRHRTGPRVPRRGRRAGRADPRRGRTHGTSSRPFHERPGRQRRRHGPAAGWLRDPHRVRAQALRRMVVRLPGRTRGPAGVLRQLRRAHGRAPLPGQGDESRRVRSTRRPRRRHVPPQRARAFRGRPAGRGEHVIAALRRRSRAFAALFALLVCALLAWVLAPKPALYGAIPFSTLVTDREGRPLKLVPAQDGRYRLFTELDDVAAVGREATLLYEDRSFYRHPGVDPLALARAAWTTYVRRTRVVGGSTITMQLARLRFDLDTRTVFGKLVQSARALQLERHYGKAEILEAYLNLAPYGGSIEGIGTASRVYFDKPASALSLGEALALAVIPQNPTDRFPVRVAGRAELLAARERLLAAWLSAAGDADPGTIARARLVPGFRSPARLPSHAPHFVRDHVPYDGGARIRTTLDLDLQGLVEARIAEHVERRRRDGIVNAAAMLVDARRMEVLALVGSAGFFDAAIAGQVNGVRAPRSPGSTLKPLLYALALDAGLIHPMTLLEDAPRRYAAYTPENFDRGFLGPVFARDALVYSRNVPAVGLLAELGVERFRDWLHGAGVADLRPAADYGLALALGGSEITMEELTRLYATLAGKGVWRDFTVVPGTPRLMRGAGPSRGNSCEGRAPRAPRAC